MAFLHELIDDYYEKVGIADKNDKTFGKICWTHAYYPHQHLEFWRPTDKCAPKATFATQFSISSASEDAFKSVVLSSPKKETNEEFLVIRAKQRPVVILVPKVDIPVKKLVGGMTISRPFALVGQIFSIVDKNSGEAKLPEDFLSDIKNLKYPQLLFLPQKAGLFDVDSLLRFDECQSAFFNYLEPTGYQFSEDLMILAKSQFRYFCCETDDTEYLKLKKVCAET